MGGLPSPDITVAPPPAEAGASPGAVEAAGSSTPESGSPAGPSHAETTAGEALAARVQTAIGGQSEEAAPPAVDNGLATVADVDPASLPPPVAEPMTPESAGDKNASPETTPAEPTIETAEPTPVGSEANYRPVEDKLADVASARDSTLQELNDALASGNELAIKQARLRHEAAKLRFKEVSDSATEAAGPIVESPTSAQDEADAPTVAESSEIEEAPKDVVGAENQDVAGVPAEAPPVDDEPDTPAAEPPEPDETAEPIFSFAADVQKELAEAEEKAEGNLNAQDRKLFETRLQEAEENDELLNSSYIRAQAERAIGGKLGHLGSRIRTLFGRGTNADSSSSEIRKQHAELYKERVFEPMKKAAKTDSTRSYEERVAKADEGAKAYRDQLKSELDEAIRSGDQSKIDRAEARYEGANQHYLMIRHEKRKRRIRSFLLGIFLVLFANTVMDSFKQARGTVEQTSQPQRRPA
ncbi:MAG: hypothetical protein HYW63_02035 [Candidatus Levybacteria bacterium]|nr:hypothetical protein [Candidatus Levybacteria bacterium]